VSQDSYELEATVNGETLGSGPIHSSSSVLNPWPFRPLTSRECVDWRVRVQGANGWSPWSEPEDFEVGLLDASQWKGKFIRSSDEPSLAPKGHRPALYFRCTVELDEKPFQARLYATAHGIYEFFIDGRRVGDLELTPGFTSYKANLEYQTYDVTNLLDRGAHSLVAVVSDGWWRGAFGFTHQDCCFGTKLALLAQLEWSVSDGAPMTVATDESWETSIEGPVRAADLMEGEKIDLRIPFPPESGWTPAVVAADPDARLTVSPAPPSRAVEIFRPTEISRIDSDHQVVDFGANINGWVRLSGSRLGQAGTNVRLRHGEMLGIDGCVDTSNLASFDFFTQEPIDVGQIDEVVSAGPGSPLFEPRHTTHGFQYVSLEGADDLSAEDISGVMVHTDLERTGWFSCSDELLNQLHEAAVLSFRGNACEVPTDCPTRERAGWTGDWQIFCPTAAFIYDVAGFSDRWLRDVAADQWDDGRIVNFSPDPYNWPGKEEGPAAGMNGSAGWGDAAVIVPYEMWQSYEDVDLLRRQYPSMRAWLEFALERAADHRHPTMVAKRPVAAPHDRFLWDVGFHWGEWTEPNVDPTPILSGQVDVAEIATAYLFRSLRLFAEIADLLDRQDDAAWASSTASDVRQAWRLEFIDADQRVTRDTQANLVRALAFGLVDDAERDGVVSQLVDRIREAGTTLGTGFLATPFLLPVLADHGQVDLAYELLFQNKEPSWLYMIEAGATTIWEHWGGLNDSGQGSLNHYSKGAVISFLHRYVAGLRPINGEPAYRRFEIRPVPGGDITHAQARLVTPYGVASSSWQREGSSIAIDVEVPPGTEATVTPPGGSASRLGPGKHQVLAPWIK